MLILYIIIMSLSLLPFFQSDLEIEPRYPLFGGWKATFLIGYGLPLQDFLFESPDGRRYLNFTFGCPLAETVVDKLTLKVRVVPCLCIHTTIFEFLQLSLPPRHRRISLLILEPLYFRLCYQRDRKIHLLWFLLQLSNI